MSKLWLNNELVDRLAMLQKTETEHPGINQVAIEKDLIKLTREDAYGHREQMPSNFSQTILDTAVMRKAVMMFKDSYLLDYINEEEIGVSRGPL